MEQRRAIRIQPRIVEYLLKQLTFLTATGLPLATCFEVIATQQKRTTPTARLLHDILTQLRSGKPFESILDGYPQVFNALVRIILAYGEKNGDIHAALIQLSEYQLRERHLNGKIRSLNYFAWGAGAAGVSIGILTLVLLLPLFFRRFFGPGINSFLYNGYAVVSRHPMLFSLSLLVVIIGYCFYLLTGSGKMLHERITYAMPVFGEFNRKKTIQWLTHTLSLLLSCAIPYKESLEVMAGIAGKNSIVTLVANRKQAALSERLKTVRFFPAMLVQLIAAGENNKNLPSVLKKVADYYTEEMSAALDALSFIIKPALVVAGGLLFTIIVYALRR